ncbi:dTDP-glucose 4,6-dehydratase [Streptomyces violaceusniger]|uniref:dTDP-glucose 4,6-dehydratase n=1 Tax=Streptomyces violaceusniger TaxID=68280 RepID=A0A4D4KYV3_STRVO|nr:dTDP-glucose 4,6-dehydratase [Streptomyces violaceusniger]
MRIVVTGGAGFVGSYFVRQALTGAYEAYGDAEIVVIDKLTYAGSEANLAEVAASPRLRLVRGDICDETLIRRLLRRDDLVVHFAAESHVDRSIMCAQEFVRTNVLGTATLLSAAAGVGVGKFVHVSTDEVYGSIELGSWHEGEPLDPSSPYSASKASSDLLVKSFHRTHGLPVCVTRASNTYGPYQHPEKLIPLFITHLLSGKRVPLYGDGENVRDWLHASDHCQGIALVAEKGRPGEVYNIGGGTEVTNRELTGKLLELLDDDWSMVREVPDRKGHDRRYSLDSGKISDELGYKPTVLFEDGLAETVAWYAQQSDWWMPLKASQC